MEISQSSMPSGSNATNLFHLSCILMPRVRPVISSVLNIMAHISRRNTHHFCRASPFSYLCSRLLSRGRAKARESMAGERAQPICRWVSANAVERRDVEVSGNRRPQYTWRLSGPTIAFSGMQTQALPTNCTWTATSVYFQLLSYLEENSML